MVLLLSQKGVLRWLAMWVGVGFGVLVVVDGSRF